MPKKVLKSPPGIVLVANNWFHEGWLYGALGLPRKNWGMGGWHGDPDRLVSDIDCESWEEGYKMARETHGILGLSEVLDRMRGLGQIKSYAVGLTEFVEEIKGVGMIDPIE